MSMSHSMESEGDRGTHWCFHKKDPSSKKRTGKDQSYKMSSSGTWQLSPNKWLQTEASLWEPTLYVIANLEEQFSVNTHIQ